MERQRFVAFHLEYVMFRLVAAIYLCDIGSL